ncbi:unnamed protein product [Clonostachys rosea f. rosea IK726]|uniref:Uncharacterized protein n=1 Tax=Clonostachys rosea f. rosea IK726 TaxID=1349383 RepID=A0ACA9ULG7_BIOOC|nr:unnamed protein product [Clonostachys rosea f. rosea IK726]
MVWKCPSCDTWNNTGNGTCQSCGWQVGGRQREDQPESVQFDKRSFAADETFFNEFNVFASMKISQD